MLSSSLHSSQSQQTTTSQVRGSYPTAPRDLHLFHVMILIGQVGCDPLDASTSAQIHADLPCFVGRVEYHYHIRAIFVDVRGAVKVVVADTDAVSIRSDVTREVRERPCALGDFVFAVLDFDQLFVVVVVCVAVLDNQPPVSFGQYCVICFLDSLNLLGSRSRSTNQ